MNRHQLVCGGYKAEDALSEVTNTKVFESIADIRDVIVPQDSSIYMVNHLVRVVLIMSNVAPLLLHRIIEVDFGPDASHEDAEAEPEKA